MYYEKWGFMLIFWNMAGVPLSYCHCTLYLSNHHPSTYAHSYPVLAWFFISYLFAYWVWDTGNSQKNMFRAQERGYELNRNAFPQLPWKKVQNPQKIPTSTGDSLLCDGWYKYARKVRLFCIATPYSSILVSMSCKSELTRADSLYKRSLLCALLGRDHGLLVAIPMVLPALLQLHDCASRSTRHSALSAEIWRCVEGVREACAVSVYTCKSCLLSCFVYGNLVAGHVCLRTAIVFKDVDANVSSMSYDFQTRCR